MTAFEGWNEILPLEDLGKISEQIDNQNADGMYKLAIYPPPKDIFNCFTMFHPSDLKVVIIGQDPYINVGQAMGLCFSAGNPNSKFPPSLMNIKKELSLVYDVELDKKARDLTFWAEQGILMLNSALTVDHGNSNSHQHIWSQWTDKVVRSINNNCEGVIFVLWGNDAKAKGGFKKGKQVSSFIDIEKNYVLTSGHPSPLSYKRYFTGNGHFEEVNRILVETDREPIDWFSRLM
jgi:uracil-DNA glycosylase